MLFKEMENLVVVFRIGSLTHKATKYVHVIVTIWLNGMA